MNKHRIAIASATLLVALAPGLSRADQTDDKDLYLKKLEARIAQLEAQQAARPAAAAAPAAPPVLSAGSLGANANVTLYGKRDRLALESGGLHGTLLGGKGGAYITDGLRAIFQLESGFFANKGTLAQGGRFFGRQAFAGLEGSWGRLTAGRQYSPLYNAVISYDPFEQGYGSPTTDGNVSTGSTRFDSSIVYATPKYAGLSANLMLAFGGETGKSHDVACLAVNYERGPFGLTAAYQNDDHVSTSTAVLRQGFLGASYQWGRTKLMAGFSHVENDPDAGNSTTRHEWMIGSQTAATATGQLLLAYAEGRTQDASPSDRGRVATLGWVETIGAQSKVYGILSAHKNSAGSALVPMGTSSAANYTVNPGDDAYGLALGYQSWV